MPAVSDDDAGTAGTTATAAGTGANPAPPSTGPGDWVAGDYPPNLTDQTYLQIKDVPGQAGYTREYKVHVPPTYNKDKPMPVVFCIHGLGQNAVMFCVDGSGMTAKSDAAGFIVVMPNGYSNSWNAGTCCGAAVDEKLDDVGLMRAIFKEVGTHLNLDLSRVYATGLSNGGYMSYRLACEAADLFVAVAPGAGAIGMNDIGGGTTATGDFSACSPAQKISILDLHGTEDPLIPYMLQAPSIERIAKANGCATTTHPATQPKSGGDTTCLTNDGCPSGIDVTACSVKGGGHVWFGNASCGTGAGDVGCQIVGANSDTLNDTDAAWEFFSLHAR
jgi:polyhydroxybutyrate depolymerase